MIVIGIDPGLADLGWAAVQLHADREEVAALGLIRTAKGKGKGVLVTDDLHRRGQELARALSGVLDEWSDVVCICAESISYPRSAAVSAMIGRAWGVIDAELQRRQLALVSASPQAIKKAVTGRKSASKDEVIDALDRRYDGNVRRLLSSIRAKTKHEHPADAVGAVVACLENDHLRLARRVMQTRAQ